MEIEWLQSKHAFPPVREVDPKRAETTTWKSKPLAKETEEQVYKSPPYSRNREGLRSREAYNRTNGSQREHQEWRAKTSTQIPPTTNTEKGVREASQTLSERELYLNQEAHRQQTELQIIEDLNEATQKYLNCPDPTESAARRKRVLFSDEKGQTEETAARMMGAQTQTTHQTPRIRENQKEDALSKDKILQDLQEVTIQYLSVADPKEAAARRQRVLSSEAEGLLETTATSILQAAEEQRRPLSPWELGIREESPPGIDFETAMQPSDKEETPQPIQSKTSKAQKKKHKLKSVITTPNILKGMSTRKRNLSQMRFSPAGVSKSPERKKQKDSSTNSQKEGQVGPSTRIANPPINLIPTAAKRKADFRFPPTPAP